ncbi:hypothetical protein HDU98_005552 [Podochytrium sp. JEL0797]|nr:hypothetical protein HDU98_005552 [Podochytrium sp. JEL0797]
MGADLTDSNSITLTLWELQGIVVKLLITGMAVEAMFKGLVEAVTLCIAKKDGRFVPIVVGLFNIFNTVSLLIFYGTYRADLSYTACRALGLMNELFLHLAIITFSVFILYRTWLVTSQNKYFLAFAIVAFLNRTAWAIYDLSTVASYISTGGFCQLKSLITPQVGYLASTIFIDIGCTIPTLLISLFYFKHSELGSLFAVMAWENLIRTTFVLAIQSVLVWATLGNVDSNWAYIIQASQGYVFAQVVNAEFWWVRLRHKVLDEKFKEGDKDPAMNS